MNKPILIFRRLDEKEVLTSRMDWRWTGDKPIGSPPRTAKNTGLGGRTLQRSPHGSLSGSLTNLKMFSTSVMDYVASDKEPSTSPATSLSFLSPATLSPKLGTRQLHLESAVQQEVRWDSKFTIQLAQFGGKASDSKFYEVEVDDEAMERNRQSMSSGSSNASTDSVTSTDLRSGSTPSSSFIDFASPLWEVDVTSDLPVFDECAPYAEELESCLKSCYAHLRSSKMSAIWAPGDSHLTHVTQTLGRFAASRPQLVHNLADSMNVKRLVIPCAEFDLPTEAILLLNAAKDSLRGNSSWEDFVMSLSAQDASLLTLYSQNPVYQVELNRLRWFLDKYDTTKEVMAYFVWSLPDASLVSLSVAKVNPYPLCGGCALKFGTRSCAQCQVARYCSRECQVKDWEEHQNCCTEMRDSLVHSHAQLFTFFDSAGPSLPTTPHATS
jgi:hypothetical protein